MKLKHLLIGTTILLSVKLFAQNYADMLLVKADFGLHMYSFSLTDSCIVDSSLMTVYYHFGMNDTLNLRQVPIRMQIGEKTIKQTNLRLFSRCIKYNQPQPAAPKKEQEPTAQEPSPWYGTANTDLFFEQTQERGTGEMQIICGDLFKSDKPMKYKDTPSMEWTLTEKTDTVAGYFCNTATTTFRGRTWDVWYTTEVPIQAGPWRLGGLPGLILKATDKTGHYSFNCYRIQAAKEPVYEYEFKRIQDLKTAEAYSKYERSCHEHPYDAFGNGQEVFIMTQDKTSGKMVQRDRSWALRYNPIELE